MLGICNDTPEWSNPESKNNGNTKICTQLQKELSKVLRIQSARKKEFTSFPYLNQNHTKYVNEMFLGILKQRKRLSKRRIISYLIGT